MSGNTLRSAATVRAHIDDNRGKLQVREDGWFYRSLKFWYLNHKSYASMPTRLLLCYDFWRALVGTPAVKLGRALKSSRLNWLWWIITGAVLIMAAIGVIMAVYSIVVWVIANPTTTLIIAGCIPVAVATIAGLNIGYVSAAEALFKNHLAMTWDWVDRNKYVEFLLKVFGVGGVLVAYAISLVIWVPWKVFHLKTVERAMNYSVAGTNWWTYVLTAVLTIDAFVLWSDLSPWMLAAAVFLASTIVAKAMTYRDEQRWEADFQNRQERQWVALQPILRQLYNYGHGNGKGYTKWHTKFRDLMISEHDDHWLDECFGYGGTELLYDALRVHYGWYFPYWQQEQIDSLFHTKQLEQCPKLAKREQRQVAVKAFARRVSKPAGNIGEFIALGWAYIRAAKARICPFITVKPNTPPVKSEGVAA